MINADYRILFVCQASPQIGLGHLARCLVLAKKIKQELKAQISFIIQGQAIIHDELSQYNHYFVDDLNQAVENHIQQNQINFIVFDLPKKHLPENFEALLTKVHHQKIKIIGIDEMLCLGQFLDLALKPSIIISDEEKKQVTCPLLWGGDCFLLKVEQPKKEWSEGNKLLILTGGSDAAGLGQIWPNLLDQLLPSSIEAHWVVGPYARPPLIPDQAQLKWIVHQAPNRLDHLMIDANYAVAVHGVSFYELLYYGIPTVVYSPYGLKDKPHLQLIAQSQIAETAQNNEELAGKINQLIHNQDYAYHLSKTASQKISNQGAQKLVDKIVELMEK